MGEVIVDLYERMVKDDNELWFVINVLYDDLYVFLVSSEEVLE